MMPLYRSTSMARSLEFEGSRDGGLGNADNATAAASGTGSIL